VVDYADDGMRGELQDRARPALVNPGMTVSTMNVPLVKPGVELSDRINMLDLNIGRWFTDHIAHQPRSRSSMR
jgi:hypothetical protein